MEILVISLVIIGVILSALLIIIKIKRNKKRKISEKSAALADQISMKKAYVDTKYFEQSFFDMMQNINYALYAQRVDLLPNEKISQKYYLECYEQLKREYEVGINKSVNEFKVLNSKVIKQENDLIYAITKILVEGHYYVDFNYSHPTMSKRTMREYKQVFVFVNMNDVWILDGVKTEEIVDEKNLNL